MQKQYPKGIWFNQPRENAPEFVLGSISISKQSFIEWLKGKDADDKRYVKLDVLQGKEGKPYCAVNNFKSTQKEELPIINPDDVLF